MSHGMWTKYVTEDGKVFYYNAEQNRSLWQPPVDSLVHEAPCLKPITSAAAPPSSSSLSVAQQLDSTGVLSLTTLQEPSVPESHEAQSAKNHAMYVNKQTHTAPLLHYN